jgi:hypothetical protein
MAINYLVLFDTFNQKVISRHRSISAAGKANDKFQRAVKKNGSSSYIPVDIRWEDEDGTLFKFDVDSPVYLFWLYRGWDK